MAYPQTFPNVLLVNTITATTVVSLVGTMQMSTTTFNSDLGLLGTVELSPAQSTATNLKFQVDNQVLIIDKMTFKAAAGIGSGQLQCEGSGTDQQGNDPAIFNRQIASWT